MQDEVKLAIEGGMLLLAVGGILWGFSSAMTTFKLIGAQQAKEIGKLSVTVDKLQEVVVKTNERDIKQTGRMDLIDERLNATGMRLDELSKRLNAWLDDKVRSFPG